MLNAVDPTNNTKSSARSLIIVTIIMLQLHNKIFVWDFISCNLLHNEIPLLC